jgi:hypothetical protein
MSGLANLRAVARGTRPDHDGLLGNARCSWGRSELLSEEAILAAFTAQPFEVDSDLLAVETPLGAALVGQGRALVADLYDGRIGRLWCVGGAIPQLDHPSIDVAFDADMRQERSDVSFRAEDHPDLDPAAVEPLLTAARSHGDRARSEGKLRVRAFFIRAFGDPGHSAALLSIFSLGNERSRSSSFSLAVIGVSGDEVRTVGERHPPRDWSPRF